MAVTKCYYTPTDFISSLTECAVKYTIFCAKLRVKNHTKPCVISFYHISEHLNCMKLANHYTFFWFYQFTQTLWERILYILFLENFKNTKLHERTGTALFSSMNRILHSAAPPYWSAAVKEAVLETDLDRTDRKDSISMLQRWEKRWNEEINLPQKNNATTLISCATKILQKITSHLFLLWELEEKIKEIGDQSVL